MARPFNRQWLATSAGLARRPGSRWTAGGGGFTFSPAESAVMLPDTAIGISSEGLTLADSGTTVQAWASYLGGLSVTLTAPTASQRPAYSASGGAGGRPLVTGDGLNDALSAAFTVGGVWTSGEMGIVGRFVGTAPNQRVITYGANQLYSTTGTAPRARWFAGITGVGTGAMTSDAHYSTDGEASGGVVNARVNGVINIATISSDGSAADGQDLTLFAGNSAGTTPANAAVQAWYCGYGLTAEQRTYLRALLTFYTGISS